MKHLKIYIFYFVSLLCLALHSADVKGMDTTSIYFDFGDGLIQEFTGTYIFKYKKIEFIKDHTSNYIIKSSGDQSTSEDYLQAKNGYTYWILSRSKENWFVFKNNLKKGDRWSNNIRGWNQTYEVMNTEVVLELPAGKFTKCAKIKISWIANEHDMKGVQEKILFLAPHIGIVKQEHYENGNKWHEEVLTSFKQTKKQGIGLTNHWCGWLVATAQFER